MLKKLISFFIVLSGIIQLSAQHIPGSWRVIPMSGLNFEHVQDSPSKVYYLTGTSLYSYSKEDNETMYYTPGSKISDSGIKFIRYNGNKKYLVVVYNNGNIDLVYDNGKVVNLPEIKEANLTMLKTVNNVQFGEDRIYVGTSFGIVIYDDVNHHVIESGIYDENIPFVFELDDKVMLVSGSNKLMYSPKKERHNSISKFTSVGNAPSSSNIFSISPNEFITISGTQLVKITVDFSNNTYKSENVKNINNGKEIRPYKDGFYVAGNDGFYLFNKNGVFQSLSSYPSEYSSQALSFWNSPASVWAANTSGIGNYDLSSATVKTLSDRYLPESSKQYNLGYAFNHNGEVYFSGLGRSDYHPGGRSGDASISLPFLLESYDWNTGKITPRYPIVEKQYSDRTQTEQNKTNLNLLYGGPGRVLFDPEDPSFMYMANNFDGLFVLKDRKVHYNYNKNNSPIFSSWGSQVYDMDFDNMGNLWIIIWRTNVANLTSNLSIVKIIPKEYVAKMKSNPEALTEKDANGQYKGWLQPTWVDGLYGKCDVKIKLSKTTNKGIAACGGWGAVLVGIDNKGTTTVNDDIYQQYSGFIDQDGTISNPTYKCWFEEDKKGNIWIGTSAGVYIINDLTQIADKSSNYLSAIRPKVARNDGTAYADYLLSSDNIVNIAVDSNNRKWIATTTSGLYCVNEDGTEILQEFNKDNSPLVSNVVTMVACDPNSNDVLIGTPEGVFVYSSDSAPARDDYSEVYAFPNPVRPDYTGWISVNGLMDNSLVKITDAQGNLVWQGKSEGGMAVWDGCDSAGNRVRAGVYMVFASQSSDGSSSGAVTKIVVIN